jgi:FkbM family methyltransferase
MGPEAADGRIAPSFTPCVGEHPILLSLLTEVLTQGDVFVDIGANAGVFTVPIAKTVGSGGRVLAFEPAPDAVETLRTAARAHGVETRITIHDLALGRQDGSTLLRDDPDHPQDSTKRSSFMPNGLPVVEVAVRSFDGLVETGVVPTSTIHAVKIDVEGAEMHVLSGMRKALERSRPRMIVIETIDSHLRRAGSSVADIYSFMSSIGYVESDDVRASGLGLNAVFVRQNPHTPLS